MIQFSPKRRRLLASTALAIAVAGAAGAVAPAFAQQGYGPASLGLQPGGFQTGSFQTQPVAPQQTAIQMPGQAMLQQTPIPDEFRQTLGQFGQFINHPRYGEVWMPTAVPQGWRPYEPCKWVKDRTYGWYYNDTSAWGQIVHHYGRWTRDAQMGWIWVPGTEFSPGWVTWRASQNYIGWAPMPPEVDIQQTSAQTFNNDLYWQFQDIRTFGQGCTPQILPRAMYQQIFLETRLITQVHFVHGIAIFILPDFIIGQIVDIGFLIPAWSPEFLHAWWGWWNILAAALGIDFFFGGPLPFAGFPPAPVAAPPAPAPTMMPISAPRPQAFVPPQPMPSFAPPQAFHRGPAVIDRGPPVYVPPPQAWVPPPRIDPRPFPTPQPLPGHADRGPNRGPVPGPTPGPTPCLNRLGCDGPTPNSTPGRFPDRTGPTNPTPTPTPGPCLNRAGCGTGGSAGPVGGPFNPRIPNNGSIGSTGPGRPTGIIPRTPDRIGFGNRTPGGPNAIAPRTPDRIGFGNRTPGRPTGPASIPNFGNRGGSPGPAANRLTNIPSQVRPGSATNRGITPPVNVPRVQAATTGPRFSPSAAIGRPGGSFRPGGGLR